MTVEPNLPFDRLNAVLRGAAEPTRLRILALLAEAELTVSDLTDILRQSPSLENAAKPAFAHTIAALQQSTPVLKFIRPYAPAGACAFQEFRTGVTCPMEL